MTTPHGPHAPPGLERILSRWAGTLGAVTSARPLDERGSVLAVRAAGGAEYVLKAVDGSAFAGEIAGRLDLLRFLGEQGVPVAAPVALDSDPRAFLAESGGRQYWLAPFLGPGIPPDEDRVDMPRLYANTGAAIARLHRALAAYTGRIRSWRLDLAGDTLRADVPLLRERLEEGKGRRERAEQEFGGEGGGEREEERSVFERAAGYLAQRLPGRLAGLPAQHIHGDCHGGNIIFDGEQVAGFVDLDHLPWAPRVYDLGYFLADMAKNRFRRPDETAAWFAGLRPFLDGFRGELELSEAEVTILPAVMMAVQVRFAAWFARQGDPERVRFNLEALYWLESQVGRVMEMIL